MDGETFGEEVITIELPKVQPQTGDTYMLEFSVQNKVKPTGMQHLPNTTM